jgi:hypothetical protein
MRKAIGFLFVLLTRREKDMRAMSLILDDISYLSEAAGVESQPSLWQHLLQLMGYV